MLPEGNAGFFFFLGGGSSSTKKCDHGCDQVLIKSSWRCVYPYISELMLCLHQGKIMNVKWVKIRSLAALQVAKYMRTVKQCAWAFEE